MRIRLAASISSPPNGLGPYGRTIMSNCEGVGYGLCATQWSSCWIAEDDCSGCIRNFDIRCSVDYVAVPVGMREGQCIGSPHSQRCHIECKGHVLSARAVNSG